MNMELLKKDTKWFLSVEGEKAFFALSTLEERATYIYSYLKTVVDPSFEEDNTLFKMAFFFADAVYRSSKPYRTYPAVLIAEHNPFLQYLQKAKEFDSNKILYVILTAILQGKVDTADDGEWIYDTEYLADSDWFEKLYGNGMEYLPAHSLYMVDPASYASEEDDQLLQLALVWMLLK